MHRIEYGPGGPANNYQLHRAMPPSQLKQLKASLRENGLVGPQQSKKQRKTAARDAHTRSKRNAALQEIRDRFNPFEVKRPARREKFDIVSSKKRDTPAERPGVTKGLGEERRKATLLREIQSRHKTGGVIDRRFGENDPSMTPEQRAAERFARQSLRKAKKSDLFNLDDDEEGGVELTHGGRALSFGESGRTDDFQEEVSISSDGSEHEEEDDIDDRPRKRIRFAQDELGDDASKDETERKKSKREVMEEVIAKSKLYKYERQKAREDDDQLRAQLDSGMAEFYDAMQRHQTALKSLPIPPSQNSEPHMNPERAALLAGKDREEVEKEYERMINEMKLDRRSRPTDRTKTEEEKAAQEAERLKQLEAKRIRRMRGDPESSDEEEEETRPTEEDEYRDDAEEFGLGQVSMVPPRPELDVEDEDEFLLDDDLVASDSAAELASDIDDEHDESKAIEDDGDDEFINGLVLPNAQNEDQEKELHPSSEGKQLAYTYPCPQSHAELLKITEGIKVEELPTIVQRIRALYHVGLAEGNRAKLEKFAAALVEHVAYLGQNRKTPATVLENLLRHLHSMAKTLPEAVALAFRAHLRQISQQRPFALNPGDLVLLSGISSIFPPSDHFHPVVTPAMLTIARYLGQSAISTIQQLSTGIYCCTLALQYQILSKRYIPEVITYLANVLAVLAPLPLPQISRDPKWTVPIRATSSSLGTKAMSATEPQPLIFDNLFEPEASKDLNVQLLFAACKLVGTAANIWQEKSSINEIIDPFVVVLSHYVSKPCCQFLPPSLLDTVKSTRSVVMNIQQTSVAARKPLLLHNHRPLAIKTSIPKFEESFNPDRHYDPDRDRAALGKLKAEHKRERKGAMRELRKDANFIAREQLREKKERDEAYEKKFKRLVAEIQGEEAHEGKLYEREKRKRRGK